MNHSCHIQGTSLRPSFFKTLKKKTDKIISDVGIAFSSTHLSFYLYA